MSVNEVLEAVRALSPEERAQVKALLDTLPVAPETAHEKSSPDLYTQPPEVTDPAERARLMSELVQRMKANPITGDPPRLTRDELHERR